MAARITRTLCRLMLMLPNFLRNIFGINYHETFDPVFVTENVTNLFASEHDRRLHALGEFLDSDIVFLEYGQCLSNRNAFFGIETILTLCLQQNKALYPETVQFCYAIMTADAFDMSYEGERVSERVKRMLTPLLDKIEEMENRYPDELTVDSRLVRYWLTRPIDDWDWLMPGLTHDMIVECQNRRKRPY